MSYDDDIDPEDFAYEVDSTPSSPSVAVYSAPSLYPVASAQAYAQSSSAMASLTGWRRLLKRESDDSKLINAGGKDLAGNITFDLDYQAPSSVLARVSLNVHMLFGSSLQSRLRGFWDDSRFVVDFYIVSDADSPFGISIASKYTSGFHTAPSVHGDGDGSNKCIQEGAMSVIILRMLQEGFASWHSSFFHTAQQCKAAQPLPQEQALEIMKQALDRPCSIAHVDRETSYITTRDEDGYLPISDNNLTEGSADFHVRFTVRNGCISAIDIDGEQLTPQRERALHAARVRLGLGNGPLPVSESHTASIIELVMGPLVAKNADATTNLFSYLSAYLALTLKNCLVFANSHTGELLPRPSLMPFVSKGVSLYAVDSHLCGLTLQDALCCIPPDVLRIIFKSADAACNMVSSRGEGKQFELCEPWPSFLLKEDEKGRKRGGIVDVATDEADKVDKGDGKSKAGTSASSSGVKAQEVLGVENKKVDEWRSSVSAVLHALQDGHVTELMAQARAGSVSVELRGLVLQQFLQACVGGGCVDSTMISKVAGYILRTLPYFPVCVFDQLLWFGAQTQDDWEDGLDQDGFCVYSIMRNNLRNFSGTELMTCADMCGPGLYFSESQRFAAGYSAPSGVYDTSPMFVLEAAGDLKTWEKSSNICTSLLPSQYHATATKSQARKSPHGNVVVRGLYMDSSRSGAPATSTSHGNHKYFMRAQAAYDEVVGRGTWGQVDAGLLANVAPSYGFKCSALRGYA